MTFCTYTYVVDDVLVEIAVASQTIGTFISAIFVNSSNHVNAHLLVQKLVIEYTDRA